MEALESQPAQQAQTNIAALSPVPHQNEEFNSENMASLLNSLEDSIEPVFLQYSSNKHVYHKIEPEFDRMMKFIKRTQKKITKLAEVQSKLSKEVTEYALMYEKTEKSLEKEQFSIQQMEEQIDSDQIVLKEAIERAQGLKDKIKLLKKENSELVQAIKEGVQLSPEQQEQLQELMDYKAKLTFDLEDELKRIVLLRSSVNDVYDKMRSSTEEKNRLELEISDLKENDAQKKLDIERETRARDQYDRELKTLRIAVSNKQAETKAQQETISQIKEENTLLEIHIQDQMNLIQQFSKEKESALSKIAKMNDESREQNSTTNLFEEENSLLEREVKEKSVVYANQRAELKRNLKGKENIVRRLRQLELEKDEYEEQKEIYREQNIKFSGDLEGAKKSSDTLRRMLDDLLREKNWLQTLLQKSQNNTQRNSEILQVYQQMKNNYEMDLSQQSKSIREYEEKIYVLVEDRQRIIKDSVDLQKNYVLGIKTLKEKEEQIFDYKKKMTEVERKLKHQQALYEAVQNDRNIYSKHLLDSQNDILQMKRRLKTMYYQINNYKEEIKSKTSNLQRSTAEYEKLNQDVKEINLEIKRLRHQNELSQAYIRKQTHEESSLIQFVKNASLEKTKQGHALQVIFAERDNLSHQVIRQTSELTKVYDHLRVLHSTLRHTDAAHLKIQGQLQKRRVEVASLRRLRNEYKAETFDVTSIEHLKTQLEYELMIEDMKCRTIKRESMMPLNIHRWRQLESTNPKLYEMILLLQGLQRRLVRKREEENEKEKHIEETEKMFLQLKSIQQLQVGAEAIDQIKQFKSILKEKKSLFKNLSSQLQIFKAQIRENEYSRTQIEKEIQELKKIYIKTRIHGGNNQHSSPSSHTVVSHLIPSTTPQFSISPTHHILAHHGTPSQSNVSRPISSDNKNNANNDHNSAPEMVNTQEKESTSAVKQPPTLPAINNGQEDSMSVAI